MESEDKGKAKEMLLKWNEQQKKKIVNEIEEQKRNRKSACGILFAGAKRGFIFFATFSK